MLKDYETEIGNTQFQTQEQENDEFQKKRLECSKDFSLRWLNTAEVLMWQGKSYFLHKPLTNLSTKTNDKFYLILSIFKFFKFHNN